MENDASCLAGTAKLPACRSDEMSGRRDCPIVVEGPQVDSGLHEAMEDLREMERLQLAYGCAAADLSAWPDETGRPMKKIGRRRCSTKAARKIRKKARKRTRNSRRRNKR